jgi:glycosyltransferase involved in cell wall biosynthesis
MLARRGDICVLLHAEGEEATEVPGLRCLRALPARSLSPGDDRRLRPLEAAVLDGEAAFHAARGLASAGFRPDAIVAEGGFGPCLHLAEAFRGVPVLGDFGGYGPDDASRAQLRLELTACRRGMVESRFQRAGFPAELRSKLDVVHPAVDTDLWAPARGGAAARAELGLSAKAELLAHCGSVFNGHRGGDCVLAAVAELQARRPSLHVWLVGEDAEEAGAPTPSDGARRAATRAAMTALDRSRLRLAMGGGRDLRRAVLRAADVAIHLADGACPSRALFEAMACGTAIAASDTPPMREFLGDGESALLSPFADPAALAANVARLLDDRALASRLGRAARRQAVADHGAERQASRKIGLLDELAGSDGRRPWTAAAAGQSASPNSA